MALKLVTDSTADISKKAAEKLGIGILEIPVFSEYGEIRQSAAAEERKTDTEFSVFHAMRSGRRFRTEAISTEAYLSYFRIYAAAGDAVIYCCTSSELSQNYTHAKAARRRLLMEYPAFEFHIIDSNEISLGMGVPVMIAAQEILNGAPYDRVYRRLLFDCMHQKLIFVASDVRYLVPDAEQTSLQHPHFLDIVPVLEIATSGRLSLIERTRDMGNAVERLLQLAGQYGTSLSGKTAGIVHADAEPLAEHLRNELQKRYGVTGFVTECVSDAVAVHVGPDAVGIVFEY